MTEDELKRWADKARLVVYSESETLCAMELMAAYRAGRKAGIEEAARALTDNRVQYDAAVRAILGAEEPTS